MRISRLVLALPVVLVFAFIASGQTEPKARVFADIGPSSQSGVKKIVNSFYVELASDSASQGYICIYGTPKMRTLRRRQITKSISFLKIDPSRVTFVDHPGSRIRSVFWIVPQGAKPPEP